MFHTSLFKKQCLMLLLFFLLIPVSHAYQPAVEFQETFNNIIAMDQVSDWSPESNRKIYELAMSGDGSRVAFKVALTYCQSTDPVCWKLYVVNADGTNLVDITPDVSPITYLRMNQNGSRVFFRSPVIGNYTDIYYCDVAGKSCNIAVQEGLWRFDFRVPYSIDSTGDNLYFKHDDGWDEVSKTYHQGLYTARTGGSKSRVMDISELPCDSECGNMNLLRFLGASGSGSDLLFVYNHDYLGGNATSLWGYSNGRPVQLDESHTYVWDTQNIFGHMLSSDGSTALYTYQDKGTNGATLNLVDMETLDIIPLAYTDDYFGTPMKSMAALSQDGRYARYRGQGYLTRVDRNDGSRRDLLSYSTRMRLSLWENQISNFSADNQRYFILNQDETSGSKLTRADINTSATANAPAISNINFSASALLHADDSTIAISVNVSDPQGLGDIESVRIATLVEGLEEPDFDMDREPLAFPSGDPGGTLLYDDGTHGDATAGDGIFSFDAIATRKGGYDGSNTFYQQFTLPHNVGVRIVAKDKSQNYSIVDVPLTITDNAQDIVPSDQVIVSDYAAVLQENFDITLQPVDIFGQAYNVTLSWYANPMDSGGLYWKLGPFSTSESLLPGGAWLEADASITMEPIDVYGDLLDVSLKLWSNPQDPFWFYWTLGTADYHPE